MHLFAPTELTLALLLFIATRPERVRFFVNSK